MAFDFKKEFKEFYMPKNKPEIVNVPNKRKTNYHIHLIFSERELFPEPIEKIATRNMFYNEHGKHVCTKKEILDDSGNICKDCKIVKKEKLISSIHKGITIAEIKGRDKSPFFRRIIHFFTFLYSVGVKEYILLNVLQK